MKLRVKPYPLTLTVKMCTIDSVQKPHIKVYFIEKLKVKFNLNFLRERNFVMVRTN